MKNILECGWAHDNHCVVLKETDEFMWDWCCVEGSEVDMTHLVLWSIRSVHGQSYCLVMKSCVILYSVK